MLGKKRKRMFDKKSKITLLGTIGCVIIFEVVRDIERE